MAVHDAVESMPIFRGIRTQAPPPIFRHSSGVVFVKHFWPNMLSLHSSGFARRCSYQKLRYGLIVRNPLGLSFEPRNQSPD